jgi:hypothetical protein
MLRVQDSQPGTSFWESNLKSGIWNQIENLCRYILCRVHSATLDCTDPSLGFRSWKSNGLTPTRTPTSGDSSAHQSLPASGNSKSASNVEQTGSPHQPSPGRCGRLCSMDWNAAIVVVRAFPRKTSPVSARFCQTCTHLPRSTGQTRRPAINKPMTL